MATESCLRLARQAGCYLKLSKVPINLELKLQKSPSGPGSSISLLGNKYPKFVQELLVHGGVMGYQQRLSR